MASHLASLWKWDFLELGNGLLEKALRLGILHVGSHICPENIKKIYFTTKQQWQISHFTPISKQSEKSRKNSKFLLVKS